MDNQMSTNKWSAIKTEITNIWNCIKNWYDCHKYSDHIIVRRKCSGEIMLCTKNAPYTPLHKVTVDTDFSLSLVELGMLAIGCALLCAIIKLLRRCI